MGGYKKEEDREWVRMKIGMKMERGGGEKGGGWISREGGGVGGGTDKGENFQEREGEGDTDKNRANDEPNFFINEGNGISTILFFIQRERERERESPTIIGRN